MVKLSALNPFQSTLLAIVIVLSGVFCFMYRNVLLFESNTAMEAKLGQILVEMRAISTLTKDLERRSMQLTEETLQEISVVEQRMIQDQKVFQEQLQSMRADSFLELKAQMQQFMQQHLSPEGENSMATQEHNEQNVNVIDHHEVVVEIDPLQEELEVIEKDILDNDQLTINRAFRVHEADERQDKYSIEDEPYSWEFVVAIMLSLCLTIAVLGMKLKRKLRFMPTIKQFWRGIKHKVDRLVQRESKQSIEFHPKKKSTVFNPIHVRSRNETQRSDSNNSSKDSNDDDSGGNSSDNEIQFFPRSVQYEDDLTERCDNVNMKSFHNANVFKTFPHKFKDTFKMNGGSPINGSSTVSIDQITTRDPSPIGNAVTEFDTNYIRTPPFQRKLFQDTPTPSHNTRSKKTSLHTQS